MNYKFPIIQHIDEIKPIIEGNDNFYIAEREHYDIINYHGLGDTFPDIISDNDILLRECRGLTFDKQGNLISRKLHKFFNLNEKEETKVENVDFNKPHKLLAKLDGSMITPILIENQYVRWCTKLGITEVAMKAECFVAKSNIDYTNFALNMMPRYTPIFEFCSRSQRIVIDYPAADLVLLAIRNNLTGNYISYDDMVELAKDYNITVVQNIDISININVLVEFIRANEDSEGIVIRFDTGHMIKIKSDWYVRIHKAKDKIRFEKDLVENIINESVDDLKPLLTEDDRIMIAKYENKMQEKIHQVTNHIEMIVKEALNKYTNRKDYAVEFVKKQPEHLKSILFYAYEGKNVKEELIKQIKKNCTSQNNLESVRHLIGLDNKKEWNNNHG